MKRITIHSVMIVFLAFCMSCFLFSDICNAGPKMKISAGYIRYIPFSEFSHNESFLRYGSKTYCSNGLPVAFGHNIHQRYWLSLEASYWTQQVDEFERRSQIASYNLLNIPISFNFRIDHIFSKSIPPSELNPYLDIGIGTLYQRFSPEVFYPPPDQYDYEEVSGFSGGFHLGFGLEQRIKAPIYLELGARTLFVLLQPTWIDKSSLHDEKINIDGILLRSVIGISF